MGSSQSGDGAGTLFGAGVAVGAISGARPGFAGVSGAANARRRRDAVDASKITARQGSVYRMSAVACRRT